MKWRPEASDECMCECRGVRCRAGHECYADDDCICGLDGCPCVRKLDSVSDRDATAFLLADQRKSGLSTRAYEAERGLYLNLDRGWGRAGEVRKHESAMSTLADTLTAGAEIAD